MIRDSISQSPRDRILWALSNNDGKMERSTLRRRVGMRLADLEPILGELAREGRIRITGEIISLI